MASLVPPPLKRQHGWGRLLVEPARPRAIARRVDAHWLVVAAVSIGAFMGQLDTSIVTLALPTLKARFDASLGAVQWVGLIYLLVLVSTVTVAGRVADMIGRKLLYTYGFLVFAVSSLACALAPDLIALDVCRAVQALGAAMMQANSVAIIALAMPREQLGRGIGIQGAAQALGLAVGPAVGGALISLGGWRLIFLVNVPIGVVGSAAAWLFVPRSRDLRPWLAPDRVGVALFIPALTTLLLAISFGNEIGWSSVSIVALFVGSLFLGIAFVRYERRSQAPLIDLALFSRLSFSAGIASGLLSYLVLFGTLFATPFLLESARNLSPGAAGALLTTMPIALAVVAPFAGHLSDIVGPRALTVGGMLVTAGSLVLLAAFHSNDVALVAELALLGAGVGAFTPSNNAAIMTAAPRAQVSAAGGILNLTRGLGASLGLTLTALVLGALAGTHASAASVGEGFRAAALFLATVALLAAAVSAPRGPRPASHSR